MDHRKNTGPPQTRLKDQGNHKRPIRKDQTIFRKPKHQKCKIRKDQIIKKNQITPKKTKIKDQKTKQKDQVKTQPNPKDQQMGSAQINTIWKDHRVGSPAGRGCRSHFRLIFFLMLLTLVCNMCVDYIFDPFDPSFGGY